MLSGAHDCYLVGKMDSGCFVPVQEVRQLGTAKRTVYAAQTYSDLPDNRRVRVSWNTFNLPDMPFNCSMATPVDVYLSRAEDGKIDLCCRPVDEIKALYGARVSGRGSMELPWRANDICVKMPVSTCPAEISLFGFRITVDGEKGIVRAGEFEMKAAVKNNEVALRFIQDVHSVELYSSDGVGYRCIGHLADYSLNRIEGPESMDIEAVELRNYRK